MYFKIISTVFLLSLFSCKINTTKILKPGPDIKTSMELSEVSPQQNVGSSLVVDNTQGILISKVPEAPISKELKICAKFIKNFIPTEEWFYQFQDTIKKYKAKKQEGRFIISHLRYNKILNPNNTPLNYKDSPKYNICGDIILSFDRYQDVLQLKKYNNTELFNFMQNKVQFVKLNSTEYPFSACTDILFSLENQDDFIAIKSSLTLNSKMESLKLLTDLLSSTEGKHQWKGKKLFITAPKCKKLILSFNSYIRLKKFMTSSSDDQYNMVGSFADF